ncbi:MAG: hypothetical protein FWG64_05340 [Firmicutes bacterium]|nr:hypothetical protein [Bacillota bacterium]
MFTKKFFVTFVSIAIAIGIFVPINVLAQDVEDFTAYETINILELTELITDFEVIDFDYEEVIELTHEISDVQQEISLFMPVRSPLINSSLTLDNADLAFEVSPNYLRNPNARQVEVVPFNTNPNLAIDITNFIGFDLSDLANHEERWYMFNVPANNKVSIQLSYQSGVYDLILFRLVGSSLQQVDYSIDGRGVERINYISQSGGIYFLAVAPFIPTNTPHLFNFAVELSSNFDAFELNDLHTQATSFSDNFSVQANLDNRFDQDWFILDVNTASTKDLIVSNAPAGNHYGVFLYDSNFNLIGSFFANGSRRVDFNLGRYFIQIRSMSGHVISANYRLTVEQARGPLLGQVTIPMQMIHNGEGAWALGPNNRLFVESGGLVEFEVQVAPAWGSVEGALLAIDIFNDYVGFSTSTTFPDWPEIQKRAPIGTGRFEVTYPRYNIGAIGQPPMPNAHIRVRLSALMSPTLHEGALYVSMTIRSFGRL